MKKRDYRKQFPISKGTYLEDAVNFIRFVLKKQNVDRKNAQMAELLAEETIVMFAEHAPEDAVLKVHVKKTFSDLCVFLRMKGTDFDPYAFESEKISPEEYKNTDDVMSEDVIRSILLRSQGEKYKYRNRHHINRVRIRTGKAERKMTTLTFMALALGLLFGILAKLVLPQQVTNVCCDYLLEPFRTMFMNALKIIIAPVVFFSIISCVSQFSSILDLGRMGLKVLGMYIMTTVIAVCLAIGASLLFHPGTLGFALSGAAETAAVSVETNVDTSLLHTIVNIVPSNFVRPFLDTDTLQIIFLAVLCGLAVVSIGDYSAILKDFFEACNSLFLTITTTIAKLIPVAVFASVSLMIIELDVSSLLDVLKAGILEICVVFCMILIYGLLILLLARLNPLGFYKKAWEGMLTSFTLSSSAAAMPTNMRVCTEKLGISPKVANFSIPLGATINMDGTCTYLVVMGLFLARAYGVEVPLSGIISLAVTIILLSLGAPGVPGAALICMGIVLEALNVPVEAVGLIIAINPLLDMFVTMSNTTGDMATALIVAKSENLLDLKKFRE